MDDEVLLAGKLQRLSTGKMAWLSGVAKGPNVAEARVTARLRRLLKELSETDNTSYRVLVEFYLNELPLKEIASVTGLSQARVRLSLQFSRVWLKKSLIEADFSRRRRTGGESVDTPTTGPGQATVIARAVEVIGDNVEAMRWLGTPVRALDYATPISLLHSPDGRESVLKVLGRLEHGVL